MKQKLLSILFVLTCLVGQSFAQSRQVSGKVTSAADGSPLSGVSITVAGSTSATQTDGSGNYSINVAGDGTLVFTYIGFTAQRVNVNSRSIVNIALQSMETSLDEVVVTGVGIATSKKKVAFSVESVDSKDLPKVPAGSIDQALVGKIAGAQINSVSGQPGQQAAILLRGINTLSTTQPMILLDGVQVNAGNSLNGSESNLSSRLSDLDLSNVERIEVIQGAAAATIYGAQGANGVIQIFTKKGERGTKPKISISSQTGFDNVIRGNLELSKFHFFGTDGQGYIVDGNNNRLVTDDAGEYETPSINIDGTTLNNKPYKETIYDNVDRLLKSNILTQNSSINVAGGSESADYALTLSQIKQNSVIKGGYDRYNLTANIGIDLFKGFTARSITQLSYSDNSTGGINGQNNINSALGTALTTPRYVDLLWRDDEGNLVSNAVKSNSVNPFYSNEYVDRDAKNTRIVQTFNFNYKPFKVLEFDYKYGLDNFRYDYSSFTKYQLNIKTAGPGASPAGGEIVYDRDRETLHNSLLSAFLKLDFEEDLDLNVPINTTTHVAYDWRKRTYQNVTATGSGFAPYPPFGMNATSSRDAEENIIEFATFGYLVNQRIDWGSLFGISGGLRVDYSSAFGAGSDPFVFPRGDAYFNFGDIIQSNNLSVFKIRGAFGKAGIQPGEYARSITMNTGLVGKEGSLYTKFTANNPLLNVEVSSEKEIGTDLGFKLNNETWLNTLNLSATYWWRTSKDVIQGLDLAPSTGAGSILTNSIDLKSNGFQISLDAAVHQKENFNWNFGVRFGKSKSIVERIANGRDVTLGDSGSGEFILREGESVGAFFGYKYLTSIDQTDVDGNLYIPTADAGDYEVVNGMVVNKATKAVKFTTDKYNLGDPNPKFNMSFINDFNIYKNLNVNVQLDWVYGNQIYNQSKQWLFRDYLHSDFDKEVTIDGTTGAFVNYHYSLYNTNNTNNFFVERGSYFRLRNLSISYDLANVLKYDKISSLRLSITGRNLFTISNYSGMDPESGASLNNPLRRGLDLHNFPNMRTVQFGVNVGF